MTELLLELCSEEIPARMQLDASNTLVCNISKEFNNENIIFNQLESFVTPRSLTLIINGLLIKQPNQQKEIRGPRIDASHEAINGFLRKYELSLEQCEKRNTQKGTFLFGIIHYTGSPISHILEKIITKIISKFFWKKSMRWSHYKKRWVRPLYRILCLFNGNILPVSFEDIKANNITSGHRFLYPKVFTVKNATDYKKKMRSTKVILSREERKEIILNQAYELAKSKNLILCNDINLLEEVCGLIQWPVTIMGVIDNKFMNMPREILEISMRFHQKYFSLEDKKGNLVNYFIAVSNMITTNNNLKIISGYEKVLRARLYDAQFFWNEDCKKTLDSRIPDLRSIIFHEKLGSLADKIERMTLIGSKVSVYIINCDKILVSRAAYLSKADLVSQMVIEFPELQGVMGKYYALNDGENVNVAKAIEEQYYPYTSSDICPTSPISIAVSLADKIDLLVGLFLIEEYPNGSKDPFGLRRAAISIIRLILENSLYLPLNDIFDYTISLYSKKIFRSKTILELLNFCIERFKIYLRSQDIRYDLINAVLFNNKDNNFYDIYIRIKALSIFLIEENNKELLISYKRAYNILGIEKNSYKDINKSLFISRLKEKNDYILCKTLYEVNDRIQIFLNKKDYTLALQECNFLHKPINIFLDTVKIYVDNKEDKVNRLQLLSIFCDILNQVADFSKIII